ncbi:DUF1003 domain-containing protein [Phenylobacterium immobile]|uniref:DUF1003 domain-containing protein n=1 Tax=Phenylobacterium immobile TaxID=21 RepID=UPI000A8131A5|nr:DUF1003 domain-containing protein [Phenylobacterium immobile]
MNKTSPEAPDSAAHPHGQVVDRLGGAKRGGLSHSDSRPALVRDPNAAFDEKLTFGQRLADQVAVFGGSWGFIIAFGCWLVLWTALNLVLGPRAFDPYPFIFLNLMLSMLAAIQAPVIMMSQNRQALKDRSDASHDYQVNLKAEIEIMALHDKLDQLRTEQLEAMIASQQEQIRMLTLLIQASSLDDVGGAKKRPT